MIKYRIEAYQLSMTVIIYLMNNLHYYFCQFNTTLLTKSTRFVVIDCILISYHIYAKLAQKWGGEIKPKNQYIKTNQNKSFILLIIMSASDYKSNPINNKYKIRIYSSIKPMLNSQPNVNLPNYNNTRVKWLFIWAPTYLNMRIH